MTEVGPGVLRLQLPIALPGLKHVNCYAIVDRHGAAVVDPGLPGPASWRTLTRRLRAAGLKPRDVHTVIVTHSHPDHYGNAARLCKVSGAQLVTHRAFRTHFASGHDCHLIDCDDPAHAHPDEGQDDLPPPRQMFGIAPPWGGEVYAPAIKRSLQYRLVRSGTGIAGRMFPTPAPTKRVRHNEVLLLADREWRAVHTPGHTLDHLCLHDPEGGVFISGDHVLPTITPHVPGIGAGPNALASFLLSLVQVGGLPQVTTVLPAHGHPFGDLAGRCKEIVEHHEERLDRLVAAAAGDGPSTVRELSRHLFRPERLGSMADSETYAHLEYLAATSRLVRQAEVSMVRYAAET